MGEAARAHDAIGGEAASRRLVENADADLQGAASAKLLRSALIALRRSVQAYSAGDYPGAAQAALAASKDAPGNALAYQMLAVSLEKLGRLHEAFTTYEQALRCDPKNADVHLNLGLAAWKMQMLPQAERLFAEVIRLAPDQASGYNNLAGVLRDQGRFSDAIALLQHAIGRRPDEPNLWNTLGTVLIAEERFEDAEPFLEEALRLQPGFGRALFNLGYARAHSGRAAEAIPLYDAAMHGNDPGLVPADAIHARGLARLQAGDLAHGWADYEMRFDPQHREAMIFATGCPRWTGGSLAGKRVLVLGEQGVGDEIMFADMIADAARLTGPDGQLMVAVEPRLVPLFRRSFPGLRIGPHRTVRHHGRLARGAEWAAGAAIPDVAIAMGSLGGIVRRTLADFPRRPALVADPERVAALRAQIAGSGEGPVIGIAWTSMRLSVQRARNYAPIGAWAEAMKAIRARFVSLQYGEAAPGLAALREAGIAITDFPQLDLTNDFEAAAALTAACDAVASAPTASAALAGALGVTTHIVVPACVWPQLGTDHYPWYRDGRVIAPARPCDWADATGRLSAALAAVAAADGGDRKSPPPHSAPSA